MLRRLLPLLVLSLLFWVLGCSEKAADPDTGLAEAGLDAKFGGFTTADEAPGFNDPQLLAQVASDESYDDPVLSETYVDSLLDDDESGFYHLRIVWGRLCVDSTVSVATDWSGSLSVNRGAEIIRRVIRFEPITDYILPRTDRKLVEWVSKTTIHNDGIAVDIVVPRPRVIFDTTTIIDISNDNDTTVTIVIDTTYLPEVPVEVEFKTGPFRSTLTLAEISALDTIIYLDDSNAVAIHGLKLDSRPCARGFLSGIWGETQDGEGEFKGVWLSRHGVASGYVKGIYGVSQSGIKVFKGKWIDLTGKFEGFVFGGYQHYDELNTDISTALLGHGGYRGVIFNADHQAIGVLKGRYHSAEADKEGFFQGRWRIYCPDLTDGSDDIAENF